jgi:hypothetical protein
MLHEDAHAGGLKRVEDGPCEPLLPKSSLHRGVSKEVDGTSQRQMREALLPNSPCLLVI